MDIYEKIWQQALIYLKEQLTPICFETWITPIKIHRIDDVLKIIYLRIDNIKGADLVLNTVKNRYLTYLEQAFSSVMEESFKVVVKQSKEYEDFVESTNTENVTKKEVSKPLPKVKVDKKLKEKLFNPNYTFDNFVIGPSNQFAHAICKAVSESPSQTYNPVFIYGGSGLGKTHLMHAIGIDILTRYPGLNVLYVSSEMFTSDFIKANKEQTLNEFKNQYRNVDVLLIDDIQFLEGKKETQNELFYTFEHLWSLNKQLIFSSDRSPEKLEFLDRRLTSRFMWNMVADIEPPEYETRVAILLKKAENSNIEIDDDVYEVITMIAEKMKDNIRELEGAFSRILGFSKIMNHKIDKQFSKKVLSDILSNNETLVTPEKIKKTVCKKFNIKMSDLESVKRTQEIAYPRQIAMYLVRELTDSSLPQIGKIFGGKHHTTVSYACEKIEYDMKYDDNIKNTIYELKSEIKE